jgi:hypothetical protein
MTGWLLEYLIHFGYALQLFALLARDVLWLRSLLVAAQTVLAIYAWTRGLYPYVFWNGLFVAINGFWIARLLRERAAVRLPDDLKALYEKHFAALSPSEFLRIWQEGERRTVAEGRLVKEGTRPDALYFLLSGETVVSKNGRAVARLPAGNFVAEMSLLTGEKTTADVDAIGSVEYMRWPIDKLLRLRMRNPVLWAKVQSVLGHDLVEKIMRASLAPAAQP